MIDFCFTEVGREDLTLPQPHASNAPPSSPPDAQNELTLLFLAEGSVVYAPSPKSSTTGIL